MSDFDKEAEREKLRKKYARDETKRANTQRMSELLLKGATMTNQHCNRCGDPLFRHNGQTFCARCQADANQQAVGDANQQTAADANQQVAADTTSQSADAAHSSPAESSAVSPMPADGRASGDNAAESNSAGSNSVASGPIDGTNGNSTVGTPSASAAPSTPVAGSEPTNGPEMQSTPSAGDLTAARDSLARTITRFAQQAETTDDPRRARELLSAAREAAETLAALE